MYFRPTVAVLFFAAAFPSSARALSPTPPPVPATPTATDVSPSTFVWRTVPNTAVQAAENFKFGVYWGVISGGRSTLTVVGTETVKGRPAYHIVSEAKSSGLVDTFYKVQDRNEAWVDQQAFVTVRYEKHIREGKFRVEESGDINQENQTFSIHSYRLDRNSYEVKEGTTTPNVLDVLGSLYYVRTLPLEVGASFSFDVLSGEKVYPLLVNVKKRETIKVPAGKFNCFRVEPLLRAPGIFVSKGKRLEVWLTADERHMPVKMRSEVVIGHVSAELLSYSF